MNFVNMLGALVLSNALVDSDGTQHQALAGSLGGQAGSVEGGLGLIDNITGALGGGAGELADFIDRLNAGGGGSGGNVELQTQSGGNDGGANGGIVAGLMMGNGTGSGLGQLLSAAIGQNLPGQNQMTEVIDANNQQAKLLLQAMILASKSQNRKEPIDLKKLANDYAGIGTAETQFLQTELQRSVTADELAALIPAGMEQQAYVMSSLSVNFASGTAASYLTGLAQNLRISDEHVAQMHTELGLPLLKQPTLGGSPV